MLFFNSKQGLLGVPSPYYGSRRKGAPWLAESPASAGNYRADLVHAGCISRWPPGKHDIPLCPLWFKTSSGDSREARKPYACYFFAFAQKSQPAGWQVTNAAGMALPKNAWPIGGGEVALNFPVRPNLIRLPSFAAISIQHLPPLSEPW